MRRHGALGLCRCRGNGVCRQIVPCLYAVALHYLHGRCGLRQESASRSLHHNGLLPCRVVEVRTVEAWLHEACVIRFAAIDAVEGYRTERIFPCSVAHDGLVRSVAVVYVEAQYHLRRTEAGHQLTVSSAALHVEEAVAQHHAQGVRAAAQHLCHVIRIIIYRLAVFAP